MKFSDMLATGGKVLRSGLSGAAALKHSGILDNIPIVSNILSGADLLLQVLDGKEDADHSLKEVKETLELVAPIVVKLAQATEKLDDEALIKNLEVMNTVLEKVR